MTKRDNETPQPNIPDVEIASKTMLGDLKKLVVEELRAAPNVWQMMSEHQQECALYRIEGACRSAIMKAMRILAAGERPIVVATIEGVTYKAGGIKATLQVSPNDANRHELSESAGAQVTIILPGGADHMGGADAVKPDAQQPAFDFEGKPTGGTVSQETRQREAALLCQNLAELLDASVETWKDVDASAIQTLDGIAAELGLSLKALATEMGLDDAGLRKFIESLRKPVEQPTAEQQANTDALVDAIKGLPAPGTVVRAFRVAPKSGGFSKHKPAAGMWATDDEDAWNIYCATHAGLNVRADYYVEEVEPKVFEQIGCLNPTRVDEKTGALFGTEQAAPPPPAPPKPATKPKPPRKGRKGERK